MATPQELNAETQALLQPILDVFGGSDGGAAFTELRHGFVPQILNARGTQPKIDDCIKMITQFSQLCALALSKQQS